MPDWPSARRSLLVSPSPRTSVRARLRGRRRRRCISVRCRTASGTDHDGVSTYGPLASPTRLAAAAAQSPFGSASSDGLPARGKRDDAEGDAAHAQLSCRFDFSLCPNTGSLTEDKWRPYCVSAPDRVRVVQLDSEHWSRSGLTVGDYGCPLTPQHPCRALSPYATTRCCGV